MNAMTIDDVTNEQAIEQINLAKKSAALTGLRGACGRGFLRAIGEGRKFTERMIAENDSTMRNTAGLYLRIFKMQDEGLL